MKVIGLSRSIAYALPMSNTRGNPRRCDREHSTPDGTLPWDRPNGVTRQIGSRQRHGRLSVALQMVLKT
jgi:hypothetical protein